MGSDSVELNVHQALLQKNAKVYLAARNETRAKTAIAELLVETGKEAIWLELDLSSFQSIEKAAKEFHRCVPLAMFFHHGSLTPDPLSKVRKRSCTSCSIMRTVDFACVNDLRRSPGGYQGRNGS